MYLKKYKMKKTEKIKTCFTHTESLGLTFGAPNLKVFSNVNIVEARLNKYQNYGVLLYISIIIVVTHYIFPNSLSRYS